ncbi:hypothetical protein [Dyadobacter sp.]|uniref:hypothetical protein n=1 Tax=Dyadobacter sp. TaxID=1914288 RepID=UPI003F7090FE
MNFFFIDEILPGISINLRALSRGTERYRVLLYQHEGVLAFSDGSKLGNLTDCTPQFRAFLNLARETSADLVMTPEYSCPWTNIREIMEDRSLWPVQGKLWALGAESITKEELRAFHSQYATDDKIFHFDATRLREELTFLNPLVYMFQASFGDNRMLVTLVQFKTKHMGVWGGGELERNHLIGGEVVYVLRNNVDSVNLLTLICSEAMNFPAAMGAAQLTQLGWNDRPFLILNPQINPDPLYSEFVAFRKFLFNQERKELISLNWNSSSKIGQDALLRGGTSRSGIYLNSNQVRFGDLGRIRKNHKLGLYYFYFGRDKHAYVLTSKAHAFLIENLSVNITEGVLAQRMRNGPEIMETFVLRASNTFVSEASISDDHRQVLLDLGCRNAFLNSADNCVLEKERLVCLSAGKFLSRPNESWSNLDQLFSIRLPESTENSKRVTFVEDTSDESRDQLKSYMVAVNTLDGEILPDKAQYPSSIADLKAQPVFLGYGQDVDDDHHKLIHKERYRYNLMNEEGQMIKATVCYLGMTTTQHAIQTYEFLQSMFEEDSMNRRRVVVFYKLGLVPLVIADVDAGRIVVVEERGLSSFLS